MKLTEIQKNFTYWRENRSHPKEKIPDELWQQVANIYSSYPHSIICRRLGISSSALKVAMQGDGFATYAPPATTELRGSPARISSSALSLCL